MSAPRLDPVPMDIQPRCVQHHTIGMVTKAHGEVLVMVVTRIQ